MVVYLYPDQAAMFRRDGDGSGIIRYAVKRWKRGDIAAQTREKSEKHENVIPFSIRELPDGVAPEMVRDIVASHLANPDRTRLAAIDADLDALDIRIAEMFKALGVQQ